MLKQLIILSIVFKILQINAQGLILEPQKYKVYEKWNSSQMGFASKLPTKVSLREYCPTPLKQEASNCVGWAVAYAALSTQYNIDMGTTNYMHKWARAFDPNFIYNFVKYEDDYWCKKGSSIAYAMDVLKKVGCKPMVWEPWLKCDDKLTYSEFTIALASQYLIKESLALPLNNLLNETKAALYTNYPVVIGAMLTESFEKGSAINFGYWNPIAGEKYTGAHAMCVIGYDDYKYGGAFEVMNSWGKDWGDQGYFWIKYDDFVNLVNEAYIMITPPINKSDCSFGDCINTYSRLKLDNGDIYEGLLKDGYPNIFGSLLFSNGSFYVGEWDMGKKNGSGLVWHNESKKFYNTTYHNDVLIDKEIKYGFAQNKEKDKIELHLEEILKIINYNQKVITDYETTKKDLGIYETPKNTIHFIKK